MAKKQETVRKKAAKPASSGGSGKLAGKGKKGSGASAAPKKNAAKGPAKKKPALAKAAPKKAVGKKPAAKSAAPKKAAVKKAAPKKAAPKKAAPKKAAPKKVAPKKAAPKGAVKKTVAVKKAAPKKPAGTRSAAKPATVAPAPTKPKAAPAPAPKKAKAVAPTPKKVEAPAPAPAPVAKKEVAKPTKPAAAEAVKPAEAAKPARAGKVKEPVAAVLTGLDPLGSPVRTMKRAMKERFQIEFYLRATPGSLYDLISTPSGFSEWFCDDVNVRGDEYGFVWNGEVEVAECLSIKSGELIRFHWQADEDPGSFFELRIRIDPMTNETCLVVTDHAWPRDMEEAKALWSSQIQTLMRVLGA